MLSAQFTFFFLSACRVWLRSYLVLNIHIKISLNTYIKNNHVQCCLNVCDLFRMLFLHKYDPQHNQIFAQVLKVDKENPIKQMTQKYSLSFELHKSPVRQLV